MVVGLTAAERARRVAALVAPKRSLANLAKRNLSQLAALVKTRLKRMQYRPGLLEGWSRPYRPAADGGGCAGGRGRAG